MLQPTHGKATSNGRWTKQEHSHFLLGTHRLTQDSSSMAATGRRSKKSSAPAPAPKSAPTRRNTSSKVANPSSPRPLRTPSLCLPTPNRRCPFFKGSSPTAVKLALTSPTSSAACKHLLTQSTTNLSEARFRLLGRTHRPTKFSQPSPTALDS